MLLNEGRRDCSGTHREAVLSRDREFGNHLLSTHVEGCSIVRLTPGVSAAGRYCDANKRYDQEQPCHCGSI